MTDREGPRRYLPVHGEPRRPVRRLTSQALDAVLTPVLASRAVFPRLMTSAVKRLRRDPSGARLRPAAALAWFGPRLSVTVASDQITERLPDFVSDGRGVHWTGQSFLDGADWSAALAPASECHVYQEVAELVAADLEFRATRSYRKAKKALQQGRVVRRYGRPLSGPDDLVAYFRRTIDLVRSVRSHGLERHADHDAARFARSRHGDVRPAIGERLERGIGVAIGADGTLVRHLGGRHRWAVVKALGLPQAAVEVRLVHVNWLAGLMSAHDLPAHLALPRGLNALNESAGGSRLEGGGAIR